MIRSVNNGKKLSYKELLKVATDLERCCIWALRFLRVSGDGQVISVKRQSKNRFKFREYGHWTYWFAGRIEKLGHVKFVDKKILALPPSQRKRAIKALMEKKKAKTQPQSVKQPV